MVTVGGCQTKLRTKSGSRSPLFDWNTDRHQCQDKRREDRGVTVVIDEVPGFRNHPNGSGELRTAGGAQS